LRDIEVFSGNTILGDGSVVMILDLNGIVSKSGDAHAAASIAAQHVSNGHGNRADAVQSLLLFKAGGDAPKAVPLSLVARLEEVERKSIEYPDGAPVVQYRGKLMPLIAIEPAKPLDREGTQQLLVFADQEKSMGLMVDEIVDIVEEKFQVDLSAHRPGLLGTSIISGKATDIIDAAYYLSKAFQDWFNIGGENAFGEEKGRRVLLVDDSPFFRNLLAPLLTVAGYTVTAVENPGEALKLQEAGHEFDAIVSDIEMPGMNGFEFAATVRRGGRWSQLPIVALSSHATPRDLHRGREAGFTDYVAKFNREALLTALQQNMNQAGGR
jgi:two-component system chemotaxis sensor kinase CheA